LEIFTDLELAEPMMLAVSCTVCHTEPANQQDISVCLLWDKGNNVRITITQC